MLVIYVILVFLAYLESNGLKYTWLPDFAQFDFMVGISYGGVPVCSGVLLSQNRVLTAATPLRYYKINSGPNPGVPLHVHVIDREWDKSVAIGVEDTYIQLHAYSHSSEAFDKRGIYSPVHDFASLTLERLLPYATDLSIRHPIMLFAYGKDVVVKSTGVFSIVGHGYADRLHVQQNVQLEAVDYIVEDVLVDCDEWIPRSWGYFVCLLNVNKFVGISPGAALLHNGRMFGLGSFSLTRGGETILLFTDLRKYKTYYVYGEPDNSTQE